MLIAGATSQAGKQSAEENNQKSAFSPLPGVGGHCVTGSGHASLQWGCPVSLQPRASGRRDSQPARLFFTMTVASLAGGWQENMFSLNIPVSCIQPYEPLRSRSGSRDETLLKMYPLPLAEINLVQSIGHWNRRQEMLHVLIYHSSLV